MRHNKKFNHLSRTSEHRAAMLSNMACSLIMHKRISTTTAKAKALRIYVEPLLTKAKEDIDYFGVYNIPTKMCLLLPIEKFSMKTIATIPFPYEDKTHNQYEAINYADYLFENIINK